MNKEQIKYFLLGCLCVFVAAVIYYFNQPVKPKDVIITIVHPKVISVMKGNKIVGNVSASVAIQFLFKGLTVTVSGDTVRNVNINLVEMK